MGYTNYWRTQKKDKFSQKFLNDVKSIIEKAECEGIVIANYAGEENTTPELNEKFIAMNGVGDLSHESFCIDLDYPGFNCCKTARKPYDVAVKAILILAEKKGYIKDFSFDGNKEDDLKYINAVFMAEGV